MTENKGRIILAYHMEESLTAKLRAAMQPLGILVRSIPETQEMAPLGLAAGMPGGKPGVFQQPASPLTEAMIVLCGLSDRELDKVLLAIRKEKLPIGLKAVLTPTNSIWNARQLQAALKQERGVFGRK